MQAEGIVNFRRYAGQAQEILEFVAVAASNRELVVDMLERGGKGGGIADQSVEQVTRKKLPVTVGIGPPPLRPGIQVLQLHAKNSRLQRIQAAVGAQNFVEILFLAAVHAKHAEPLGHLRIVGSHQATVACPTQIFRREKAEAAKGAE